MVQLSDDCFAFGGGMLTVEEALVAFTQRLGCVTGTETVPLDQALGRVLAHDLTAPLDLPPFANSAVDGYALRHADLDPASATLLAVEGRIAAGDAAAAPLAPGTAARIFTGAPLPPGADTVLMQEDARIEGGAVAIPPGLRHGANARPAGEDVARGAIPLAGGTRLGPAHLALAAGLGLGSVVVRARLRVGVVSTGNELVPPGQPLGPGQIHDSNRTLLAGLVRSLGAEPTDLGIVPDREDALARALRDAASGHDLLLTSGGVSTGDEDHVKPALETIGRLDLWRIAIKPGRPVALGRIGEAAFAGLPGNPAAVMTTFLFVVRPIVLLLSGATVTPPLRIPVRAGFAMRKKPGRREYVRASLRDGVAHRFAREGAGLLSSITGTDGLLELPEAWTGVAEGQAVDLLPWSGFG